LLALTALSGCLGGDSSGPSAATHFSVTAPSMATAGTPLAFSVTARDGANNVVAGYSGTVRISSTDGQAVLPRNSTLTNGSGTFSITLRTAGSQTITATDTVTASITGNAPSIEVSAGEANHLSVAATTAAQSGTAFHFTVFARDAASNVAKGYSGTVHFSSSDAHAILPANSTLTDGTGTFSVTLQTAGRQTITATDTVTPTIVGTSSAIAVSSGSPTHFAISAPAAAQSGTALTFTVSALDTANNVANSYSGTVSFSSTDAQATLPPNSALTNGTGTFSATLQAVGSQTLTATDIVTASITGTSSAIAVGPAPPPIHFSVSAPTATQSGKPLNLIVTALNTANEVAGNYGGTVQFSSTDVQAALPANSTLKNGSGTFSATLQTAGNQTVTATDTVTAAITGTSASIDVSPGPATHFSVSGPSAVEATKPFTLIVTARDAANNLAPSYAGTARFTSTDASALLPGNSTLTNGMAVFSATLSTTGIQTISATDTVTASITGTSQPIDVVTALCRTRGERCSVQSGAPCCPGLRCTRIPGGVLGGSTYLCEGW